MFYYQKTFSTNKNPPTEKTKLQTCNWSHGQFESHFHMYNVSPLSSFFHLAFINETFKKSTLKFQRKPKNFHLVLRKRQQKIWIVWAIRSGWLKGAKRNRPQKCETRFSTTNHPTNIGLSHQFCVVSLRFNKTKSLSTSSTHRLYRHSPPRSRHWFWEITPETRLEWEGIENRRFLSICLGVVNKPLGLFV